MRRILLVFPLAFSLLASSAVIAADEAAPGDQSDRVAALSAKGDDEDFALLNMTCADVLDLFADATPAEDEDEGKQKAEDKAELFAAQDDLLDLVIWVHGYLSGRDGIGEKARLLSKSGIEKTIHDIAEVCKSAEPERFLDVVSKIK